ncbi:MAG TPA: DUF4249 domain-containing protein [Ohtaekwangia sp.]|uniref:DUF4249 domain-containing protein n=1 Tax=Ohtaekwangia sp. TaxID=2066019 RepID=UPI002F9226CD
MKSTLTLSIHHIYPNRYILYQYTLLIIICTTLLTACVEPYAPPAIESTNSYLVIDGYINSSDGSATVKLSRSVSLSSTDTPPAELNATASIEDDKGNTTLLTGDNTGKYTGGGIPINSTSLYRLRIKTSNNKEYLSDYITLKDTPPIDELTWAPGKDGVNITVSTHDDSGNSRYYRWDYDETWEYTAVYLSGFIFKNDSLIPRPYDQYIYRCWRTTTSHDINIASSDQLAQDIIDDKLITHIPVGSQKLFIKYSMLLRQRALTREAYNYWEQLEKTTESLGGLFDPQPGKVAGNIYNTADLDEPVLGYFSGGTVQSQRFFLSSNDLPNELRRFQGMEGCMADTVLMKDIKNYSPLYSEAIGEATQGPVVIGYIFTSKSCADCRVQGGTTTKPDFWQ